MCLRAPLTLTHDEAGLQNSSEQRSWVVYLTFQSLGSRETISLGLLPLLFAAHTDPHRSPFDCFTRLAFQLTEQSLSGQQFRGNAAEVFRSVTESEIYHYSWVVTASLEGQSIMS